MKIANALLLALLLAASQDPPVIVEQIISRENPNFSGDAPLTVGRDGRVYLASGGNNSHVLRFERDGGGKRGGPVTYACANAVANAQGIIATASGHFAHKVTLYDAAFREIGAVSDFLVGDTVGWDAPAHVEAGAGGDFYAVDQHRNRIVRISPAAKVVTSYAVPREPEGGPGLVEDFRVWEKGETLYALSRAGRLRALGFDGKKKWEISPGVGHRAGGFDVDEIGTLFALSHDSNVLRRFAPDGKPAGEIALQMNGRKPRPGEHAFTELRIHGGEAILKRRHATDLFERYDLATGALKNVVVLDHERLRMTFPKTVWTAGEAVPFTIDFSSGARSIKPTWRIWARPLQSLDYRELVLKDGAVQVPADLAGLIQVKVTPEVQPRQHGRASEYLVQAAVEVRRKGTAAMVAVVTPGNRTHFARGEEIPFSVVGAEARGQVRLLEGTRVVASTTAESGRLGKETTSSLRPGSYRLELEATDRTVVPAAIVIGPGQNPSAFTTIQYADYGQTYPTTGPNSAPDIVDAHVARLHKLGVNLAVDRIGSHIQVNDLAWSGREAGEIDALAKKFPHLAATTWGEAPLVRAMGGYSAQGIRQMAILMYMDAGLPLGAPGFDQRKPEELAKAITKVTNTLKPYPAFRGWSWASNWWLFEGRGSKAARTPEQKAAYEAALKRAHETGAWDPVLDEVAERRLGYAVEAQELFARTMKPLAPHLVTAVAGPYRNVEAYPPITFSNVDEIDLQAQWEQIAVPLHAPHSVDFYGRPGKKSWVHPEAWNDSGTGDQLIPTLLSSLQRGADGIGISGAMSPWNSGVDGLPHDSRSGHYGTVSVFRALNDLLHRYGTWWTSLTPRDPIAIVADGRMLKTDDWGHAVCGKHFARLLEAYGACLFARLPATHVFPEDATAESLKRFKAILVVSQQVEMEPRLLEALKGSGVPVFHDGTCRPEVVKGFRPLGVSFDHFEKDGHPASDDHAYWRVPAYFRATAPAIRKAIAGDAPAIVDNDEILVAERASEEGRYVFLVNNTTPEIEPGQLWRQTLCVSTRVPLVAPVNLSGPHVYDAFAHRKVEGPLRADLRNLQARLYAVLPAAIARIDLQSSPLKPGDRVAWTARVLDGSGKPIRASIPVRVRLLAGSSVLDEWTGPAGSAGAKGSFVAPINAENLALDAVEFLSGTTTAPIDDRFGPHVRDLALIADGSVAVMNAMNWDHNLYAVDTETGKLRWRQRAGHGFAFAPTPIRGGFAVQGFHFDTAEGYQLHLANPEGAVERRFPLYGLPGRLPHRFVPGIQKDRINHFAVPESGSWAASAGDLGVAVWSREGALLWSIPRWETQRKAAPIAALDGSTLLVMDGMTARAHDALTGKPLWTLPLASTGEATEIRISRGRTCAILATTEGGRVFVLRDGVLIATHITGGGNAIDLSADGSLVALVTGNLLKVYSATGGLRWTYSGDDYLRFPRISPDGKRIAVSSDLGTLTVTDAAGALLLDRDLGAVAVPAWLPGGDLLVATWMGTVRRLDATFAERWKTVLRPEAEDIRGRILTADKSPLAPKPSWTNTEASPLPLTPNLLSAQEVLIQMAAQDPHIQFARPFAPMVDGKGDAPPQPWLSWSAVGLFAEQSPFNTVVIDTFRTQLRVTAITFAEDPAHPESWLRDLRFEAWDPLKEQWFFIQDLRSDSAVHTHKLQKPVEAARFRLVLPWGVCGNIRLGEIVLHGEKLGSSHPDVIARKPVAVLFDEGDDLKQTLANGPLAFKFEGARSGGRCLSLAADTRKDPHWQPPFGHVIPNWDFEIVENPQPGQYRWLQFSWRSPSPGAKGLMLALSGANYGEKALFHAGSFQKEDGILPRKIADGPPQSWETVRVDLWDLYRKPVRIRSMSLAALGGPAAFDQILLAREEKDLPPKN
jgi:outer membrane protein assembly factor BamB